MSKQRAIVENSVRRAFTARASRAPSPPTTVTASAYARPSCPGKRTSRSLQQVKAHSLPPRRRTRAALWIPVRRRECAAASRAWIDTVPTWIHWVGDSVRTRGGAAAPRACTLKSSRGLPSPGATGHGSSHPAGPGQDRRPSLCDLACAASCLAGLPAPARAPERKRWRAFDCVHLSEEGGARLPRVGVQAAEQPARWWGGRRGGGAAGAANSPSAA